VDALILLIFPALPPDVSGGSPSTGMLQPFHLIDAARNRKASNQHADQNRPTEFILTERQRLVAHREVLRQDELEGSRRMGLEKGAAMNELEQVLAGESAHAAPSNLLGGLSGEMAHRRVAGAPHTIYQELWHIAFWQQVTLDWIGGIETPFPATPTDGFPSEADAAREDWEQLRERFFSGSRKAAAAARDAGQLERVVRCPSRPGEPTRTMTAREQLESLGAHNAYHFGRIVLLRQLLGTWPPPSGGYSW
jgi:uncharacterized damage-inducible protein DinB